MNLPRLHPEDLQKLTEDVTKALEKKLVELFSNKEKVADTQTFTVKEVAKILNCNETTILRYIKKKLLIATKPGKDWIITQESLKNYIDGK